MTMGQLLCAVYYFGLSVFSVAYGAMVYRTMTCGRFMTCIIYGGFALLFAATGVAILLAK